MPGERNGNSTVTGCLKPSSRVTTTFSSSTPLRTSGAFGWTMSMRKGTGSITAAASFRTRPL